MEVILLEVFLINYGKLKFREIATDKIMTMVEVIYRKTAHCFYLGLNGLLTMHNFRCIPGMLGTYTIQK